LKRKPEVSDEFEVEYCPPNTLDLMDEVPLDIDQFKIRLPKKVSFTPVAKSRAELEDEAFDTAKMWQNVEEELKLDIVDDSLLDMLSDVKITDDEDVFEI
jgi:hypothetical protein